MSVLDPELIEFLDVLERIARREPGTAAPDLRDGDAQHDRLLETGVLDLGSETLEMEDGLRWLVEVVARAARHDPSLGYVLAARYVGQRAVARAAEGGEVDPAVTATLVGELGHDSTAVTVARRFAPTHVVAIETTGDRVRTAPLDSSGQVDTAARSGLRAALLEDTDVPDGTTAAGAAGARADWALLLAAASIGTAEGALAVSTAYATDRQQFDTRLIDFAGLRAVLGEMGVKVAQSRALLDAAVSSATASTTPEVTAAHQALVATAGRAAVDVAIDAIQVHGGYGYIEEYPVAGMLRDAISLRARALPRRVVVGELVGAGIGGRSST